MIKPLPCIACGAQPEPAFPDKEGTYQPYGATMFNALGQYGSTVWDPMSGRRSLMINVCDECLIKHQDRAVVARSEPQAAKVTYTAWNPQDDA